MTRSLSLSLSTAFCLCCTRQGALYQNAPGSRSGYRAAASSDRAVELLLRTAIYDLAGSKLSSDILYARVRLFIDKIFSVRVYIQIDGRTTE